MTREQANLARDEQLEAHEAAQATLERASTGGRVTLQARRQAQLLLSRGPRPLMLRERGVTA